MAHIVTAREICSYLKLSDSTIYKLALNGELPGFKVGDSWRFDMDEIIEHIKAKKETVGVKTISTRRTKKNRERKVREGWKK